MSEKPTVPDSGLSRFVDEGYEVELRHQHLLVHSVPYVTSTRDVARGTLACTYVESGGAVLPPDNHQVWWTGEYPCLATGGPIEQIANENGERELFPGFIIRHRFSNKPEGVVAFPDHYSKVIHYLGLLQSQAKAIDPDADARTRRAPVQVVDSSPFCYSDSASARAEIQATSARLAMERIAIIGLGGTGSYVLDQVAKTPVREIHLFDGDVFLQHNAFRAPGAATFEELAQRPYKADYFCRRYSAMHKGIFSHAYDVTASNIGELSNLDFVFLCVDQGGARGVLFKQLTARSIAFVDVGMHLRMVPTSSKLIGSCRSTLCTPSQNSHFSQYAPLDADDQDALYRQNIQVADMNALNAQLAVMQWKQFCGFYQDDFHAHNLTFSVNSMSLVRDVLQEK